MKILFLSSLYRSPHLPTRSVGNARIVGKMRRYADVRVISPVPWYPPPVAARVPRLAPLVTAPPAETEETGEPILHPRHLHLPGFGRTLYAGLFGASLLPAIRREVATFRPDAILSAWAYPDGTAAVALGKLLGLPTLIRVMGSDINEIARLAGRKQQIAWALREADGVIAVSRALADACLELGGRPHRVRFVPTGVDRSKFFPVDRAAARAELGIGAEEIAFVVPARLSPEKGVHFFVEALGRLERARPGRHRGVLAGAGPEEDRLRQLAAQHGVADRLVFAGWQAEARMKHFYAAADVVVLPSLNEGWPDALMESFACGAPVVAARVGGIPDIVDIGGDGALFDAGDVTDLTRALTQMAEAPHDRAAIAARLADYDLDRTGKQYVEACADAAGMRPDAVRPRA